MAVTVEFPEVAPRWVFEREGVAFPAFVGGRPLTCLAAAELLYERFGARSPSQEEALRAFEENRSDLENLARAQVVLDRAPADGELLLTSETLALEAVAYSEAVRESGDFPFVKRATAYLSDVLGPSAPHVTASWDRNENKGQVNYLLRLSGLGTEHIATIPRELMHKPSQVYVWIARLWGNLLQQKSHRLLRQLTEAGRPEG